MGSACLFFSLQPKSAVLGDLNPELIKTFHQVRDNPLAIIRHLKKYPRTERFYYRLRQLNPNSLGAAEAAARFIYLNRFCFNGLYRTNLAGNFNVPHAKSGTGDLPAKEMLLRCSDALRVAELKTGDFAEVLCDVRRGDFVYLDPPFAVKRRRVFREYGADVFQDKDLQRLDVVLRKIDKKGARFVVSYADCKEGRKILAPWKIIRVRTRRNIAGFSLHRRHAYELIATNLN